MAREYNSQLNLKYPNIKFCRLIQGIIDTEFSLLPSICHRLDFKSLLISRIKEQYNLEIISCPIHIKCFQTKILNFTIKLVTNHWCVEVNRLLHGKIKLSKNEKDQIKIAAADRFNKFSKFKK